MATSVGVERRHRSHSYSQGDSSNYSFQLRSSVKKELKESQHKDIYKESMYEKESPLYGTKNNTILEDYEVDVAILLSQMNKHNVDRVEDSANESFCGSASSPSDMNNSSHDLTDEEYRAIFQSCPRTSFSDSKSTSAPKAFKSSRARSYSEHNIFEKKNSEEIVMPTPGLGVYSIEERRNRIQKFIDKRSMRVWTKKIKYDVRKNFADSRVRIKGRFVKKEEEGCLKELLETKPPETDARRRLC